MMKKNNKAIRAEMIRRIALFRAYQDTIDSMDDEKSTRADTLAELSLRAKISMLESMIRFVDS